MEVISLDFSFFEQIYDIICQQFVGEAWTREQLLSSFQNKDSGFYGILDQNILVCFACTLETVDCVDILYIATRERYKKRGYAKSILKYIIYNLKEGQNCSIEVKASNIPAINLYKSLNFKTLFIRKKYYKDGSDAFCMFLN